jgi:hypothetical protein
MRGLSEVNRRSGGSWLGSYLNNDPSFTSAITQAPATEIT